MYINFKIYGNPQNIKIHIYVYYESKSIVVHNFKRGNAIDLDDLTF